MGYECGSMKLVGARPDGSGFFNVCLPYDTPDGTYWMSDVKIVIRSASGWSLWRYLLTIVGTVLRPGSPRVRNLMLVGRRIARLTFLPWTQRVRLWAASRGVLISTSERGRQ